MPINNIYKPSAYHHMAVLQSLDRLPKYFYQANVMLLVPSALPVSKQHPANFCWKQTSGREDSESMGWGAGGHSGEDTPRHWINLDWYTVPAWWQQDCHRGMRHGLWLAGITLLWLVDLKKVGYGICLLLGLCKGTVKESRINPRAQWTPLSPAKAAPQTP